MLNNTFNYNKFRTPFFDIEIADSSGKRRVKLPQQLLRLIERVEVMETFEPNQFPTITITFIEGSREPAIVDRSAGTSGLYKVPSHAGSDKVDMDIAGAFHNRAGLLTDLRFSGNSGITFLTEKERKIGKIDTSSQLNVESDITTRAHKSETSSPEFLFTQRNRVSVTWGYKEDPESIRTTTAYIININTNFPESGQPTTTIVCQSSKAFVEQLTAKNSIPFGKRVQTGQGNFITQFEDIKTYDLLNDLAKRAGMPSIISENLPAEKLDKDKQKVLIAGTNFKQFLDQLAKEHDAVWDLIPGKSGVDTLVFITRKDLYSKLALKDPNLFSYKQPGSILKSVNITVDFGGLTGATVVNSNSDGSNKGSAQTDPKSNVNMFEGKGLRSPELVENSPTGKNPIPVCSALEDSLFKNPNTKNSTNIQDDLTGLAYTGSVELVPIEDSKGLTDDKTAVESAQKARLVNLDFTTLGYTKVTPGVIEFRNLGVRYSGAYKVITVTHIIDSSGYNCKGTAISEFLNGGGVVPSEVSKTKDIPEKQVNVKLYREQTTNSTTSSSNSTNSAKLEQLQIKKGTN